MVPVDELTSRQVNQLLVETKYLLDKVTRGLLQVDKLTR